MTNSAVLISGPQCLGKVRELIIARRSCRIMIVRGKSSYALSGAESFIRDSISGMDVEAAFFSEFTPNPSITDLQKGIAKAREFVPDFIIAVGGGSVIDMAKLIRFFLSFSGDPSKGEYTRISFDIPLLAIPTTAGTGSETTRFAVLYIDGSKHSVDHPAVKPDYVALIPELTYANPPYLTACTGFDAFAQAIEAYWSCRATSESDSYAIRALELLHDTLPLVVEKSSVGLRGKMALGAYWAGKAIDIARTTAAHAISYPFTIHYGIPHGHAVALTFPEVAALNLREGIIPEDKRQKLMSILCMETSDIREYFRCYIRRIGLTLPDKEYNLDLLLSGVNSGRLANNPSPLSPRLILTQILSIK